jgi:hypothetical protein
MTVPLLVGVYLSVHEPETNTQEPRLLVPSDQLTLPVGGEPDPAAGVVVTVRTIAFPTVPEDELAVTVVTLLTVEDSSSTATLASDRVPRDSTRAVHATSTTTAATGPTAIPVAKETTKHTAAPAICSLTKVLTSVTFVGGALAVIFMGVEYSANAGEPIVN